ncbi:unnamed protein product [Bursaphelenchus okinawaensis]|uniref:Uncharacterized protein n=1 Tax=Bursaphelenchus okinawaensis TaxID=465554 RepID=A0A811LR55_9BILA|nr:unnamed protein product [Bursaphelenchus okinawaensis]CAG9127540.1 unnamed protein product [Bursaphelenchus okinawaensis]
MTLNLFKVVIATMFCVVLVNCDYGSQSIYFVSVGGQSCPAPYCDIACAKVYSELAKTQTLAAARCLGDLCLCLFDLSL